MILEVGKMSVTITFKKRQVIFDPLMKSNYHAYLESEEWKEKRKEVIQRADFCCEICGNYLGWRGEVHHSTYENIFEEDIKDLTYCCPDCHP